MARTIKFHLNEHCDRAIAVGLRHHGIDVTTTPEAGLTGATDEQQLAFATASGRVIFTNDTDYLRLNAIGTVHTGIAFCRPQRRTVGEIIQGLVLMWEVYDADELTQRVEYI